MKISGFNKFNISYAGTSFKGYDAIPLKALHLGNTHKEIERELQDIAQQENFVVKTSKFNESFNQDFKAILNNDGTPHLVMQQNIKLFVPHLSEITKEYGMNTTLIPMFDNSTGFISGGNFFIGKKPNGEKWMLIGQTEQKHGKGLDKVSELYGVNKENIHFIPQQDYHLDMSIRPIGYPYVLVNSPEAAYHNETEINGENTSKTKKQHNTNTKHADNLKELERFGIPKENIEILDVNADLFNDYDDNIAAYKATIKALKEAGFCPISIGGVYENGINFMNAIINKHPDGTISYITNSSKSNDPVDAEYQRIFEKDLRKKLDELAENDENAPKLQDIYFIEGKLYDFGNKTDNILEGSGGIHCMTLEEPNFELWT